MLLEILDIGVSSDEPEKFVNNRFEMDFFSRQERKSFRKVKPHLIAEDALRSDAGAVFLHHSVLSYMP